jgi:hypothetical protein
LDKIRLQAGGQLPADYVGNLSKGFDLRCCNFLRVPYATLQARTLTGGTDEEILAWAFATGGARTDEECLAWNSFLMKRGWRDDGSATLKSRIKEFGLEGKPIETFFDLNEFDEERDPVAAQAWLP